jgi:membrane protease YdiL (CAAX protease family)
MVTLAISSLPTILWKEITGEIPIWHTWVRLGLLAIFLAASFLFEAIKPLRHYFLIFFILLSLEWGFGWLGGQGERFHDTMLGIQLRRFCIALLILVVMLLIKRRREAFFLVKGQLDAPVEPVRWLGVKQGVTWYRFGTIITLVISIPIFVFLVIAGQPSLGMLAQVVTILPAVLLFSAMNAFSEEISYRAAPISTLLNPVGGQQALLLTSVYFGLAHFYGVPYSIIGVLITGLLGWLLGKSMLETKGFFWAWFIHFIQDVMIFSFIATCSISIGGG